TETERADSISAQLPMNFPNKPHFERASDSHSVLSCAIGLDCHPNYLESISRSKVHKRAPSRLDCVSICAEGRDGAQERFDSANRRHAIDMCFHFDV
ncbi:hypothetical protein K0M31_015923, partial [Melipona bicolor]